MERAAIPKGITLTRPVLGLAVLVAAIAGEGTVAAWCYLLGFLTDVADGAAARTLGVVSEEGRRLDARADMAFHVMAGLGVVVLSVEARMWWILVVAGALVFLRRLSGRWVAGSSIVSKAAAGGYFAATFIVLVVLADPGQKMPLIIAGLFVLLVTYVYEGVVMHGELRRNERSVR
jgi:phosphatidylglycerophosphate synthase